MKKILLRHLGNLGDAVFFIPPLVEGLKEVYPDSHITLVTVWGFKEKRRQLLPPFKKYDFWGNYNQGGFTLHVLATNPHIDQLIQWHDKLTNLEGDFCQENGKRIPTWSKTYYQEQIASQAYDQIVELDVGITHTENPLRKLFSVCGIPQAYRGNYTLYLTPQDMEVARQVMLSHPKPRIVLLEGLNSATTRAWDTDKIKPLEEAITAQYGQSPIWFGGKFIPSFEGRPLTLRENIATLTYCQVAIGPLSGPLHLAAAVGTPTLTLYADQPLHRAAPAYFINPSLKDPSTWHRTLLGPTNNTLEFLKNDEASKNLTAQEKQVQQHISWEKPGRQSTKTPLAALTVDEIMMVLNDMVK